jgi:hypothetical protein
MNIPVEQIADVLGGRQALGRRVKNMRELDDIVREGMPKTALDTFITRIGPKPYRDMAVRLRNKIVPRYFPLGPDGMIKAPPGMQVHSSISCCNSLNLVIDLLWLN